MMKTYRFHDKRNGHISEEVMNLADFLYVIDSQEYKDGEYMIIETTSTEIIYDIRRELEMFRHNKKKEKADNKQMDIEAACVVVETSGKITKAKK